MHTLGGYYRTSCTSCIYTYIKYTNAEPWSGRAHRNPPFSAFILYNGCSPDKGIALSSQMIYLADISILYTHRHTIQQHSQAGGLDRCGARGTKKVFHLAAALYMSYVAAALIKAPVFCGSLDFPVLLLKTILTRTMRKPPVMYLETHPQAHCGRREYEFGSRNVNYVLRKSQIKIYTCPPPNCLDINCRQKFLSLALVTLYTTLQHYHKKSEMFEKISIKKTSTNRKSPILALTKK